MWNIQLTLPVQRISESCIEIKIKLIFSFWCLKRFYEGLYGLCSINKTVLIKHDTCIQALTNLLLSNVRSRTPVLQYLFVNVLPYQNICTCSQNRKCRTRVSISTVFFWVSVSMLLVFLILALCYACNILEIVGTT